MTFTEFEQRFTAELIRLNGHTLDLDGTPVADHAKPALERFYTDPRNWKGTSIDPEACALAEYKTWEFEA